MPITFKIITNNLVINNSFELLFPYEGIINLKLLNRLLLLWNFSNDEISLIKFIFNKEKVKDNKNYYLSENDNNIIYILSFDSNIKYKLQNVFIEFQNNKDKYSIIFIELLKKYSEESNKEESDNEESNNEESNNEESDNDSFLMKNQKIILELKSNTTPELPSTLTPDIIDNINQQTVLLFEDDDFKHLLKIYLKRPELYEIFLKYIENADIIEVNTNNSSNNDLSDELLLKYKNLCDKIKNLNLNIKEEVIISRLIKYSGHLNLTLRAFLQEM